MKCKNCGTELEEGVTVCPNCGADSTLAQAGEKASAAKKTKGSTIALIAILVVIVVAFVAALAMGGTTEPSGTNDTSGNDASGTVGTTEATEATIPADGNPDDVTCKGSYTVSDEELLAAKDTVVATLGDAQLTVSELQVYYWLQFYDFMEYYGSYAPYFGLDYTQPLDTQISIDGTTTWQQYFLDSAISVWQNYQALSLKGQEAGFQLDQELVDSLDSLPEEMEQSAIEAGFASAEEMIQADMGAAATMAAYQKYLTCYYNGYMYFNTLADQIQLTDAEIEAYFDENAEAYAENGLEKDDAVCVDVRHILLQPQGGTTDESGNTTYSDEEWETCRAAAQAILDQWLAGEATEDTFAELANANSTDTGSNTNGGLYEGVCVGDMVEPFENWCFDASRKTGDYGLVQTTYGYHVMYFVGSESVWMATAREDLLAQRGNEIVTAAKESYEPQVDYSAIVLGNVDLGVSG